MKRVTRRRVGIGIIAVVLVGLALCGPRPSVEPYPLKSLDLPEDLDGWLAGREALVPGIRPGLAKGIRWIGKKGVRAPLAVVYLHGFSASRDEVSPVVEKLADSLGANVFFTRLTGHGLADEGETMKRTRVSEWFADVNEALEIGKRIGERVVVVGTSTGATLAVWAALRTSDIAAMALLSPNFGPRDERARVLLWPWGVALLKATAGTHRSWSPKTPEEARIWTYRYPVEALVPMMSLVEYARAQDLSRMSVPMIVLYTDADKSVSPDRIREMYSRFTPPDREIHRLEEAKEHVLAGDAISPATTDQVVGLMERFLRRVLGLPTDRRE